MEEKTLSSMERENFPVISEARYSFRHGNNDILGHLVIDSTVNGLSTGGVRMVPEISMFEISHLARTMTLKYSFLNLPFGGAKAAVLTGKKKLSEKAREERIKKFAGNLTPFKHRYRPGKDIGIDDEIHGLILKNAGLREYGAGVNSAFYTSLTVVMCAEEIARKRNIGLKGCRVVIEGFGKVGSWVARQLSEMGCRIIALSTDKGAVMQPDGLNIERLLRLREVYGDYCVRKYENGQRIAKEDILVLSTDFLIPCAMSWSINLSNVDDIKAKVILCGANNPVTDKAKEILGDTDTLYFPDFVSNCGGVFGAILETLYSNRMSAVNFIKKEYSAKLNRLLGFCKIEKHSMEEIAKDTAMANFSRMKQGEGKAHSLLFSSAMGLFRQGLVPGSLIRLLGPIYLRAIMNP